MPSFRNQVVLIIGASRGVGAPTAVKFADAAVEGHRHQLYQIICCGIMGSLQCTHQLCRAWMAWMNSY